MIFKDRRDAGEKLSEELLKNKDLLKKRKDIIIVSLLRGGVVVGKVISKKLKVEHLALVITKIPAPYNPELAIGALCFDTVYLDKNIINLLSLDRAVTPLQIDIAREKQQLYIKRFSLKEKSYNVLKNKTVILTDDGIATGSTIKAAHLFIKTKKPKKIILAVPVAPTDFDSRGLDKTIILHQDSFFSSVSQFYDDFPQVEDEEVKRLLISNY